MKQNEAIQRQFAAAADRYRTSRYHLDSPDLDAMLAAGSLRGHERVLDIGTGCGHTALAFAPRVASVVGLDLTPAMLEQARALAGQRGVRNVRFELGEAEQLPYPDAHFNLVTCRVCAHHFRDPRASAREAARVLRPGGTILWVDSVSPEDPTLDSFLNRIELIRDPSHVRNHRVSEWVGFFAEVGLEAAHLETWGVPLDFEDWTERMLTSEPARAQLRALLDGAARATRQAFAIRAEPRGFDMPIALLRVQRREAPAARSGRLRS